MLDIIDTLNNLTSADESDPLPPGHYLGLWVRVTGTGGAGETDAMLGDITMRYEGPSRPLSDIVNITGVNLRRANRLFGGIVESTNGAAFAYSMIVPFSHGPYPNTLYIGPQERCTFRIDQTTSGTVTASSVAISGIYSDSVPMNYIPILAQRRWNTLGGIQSQRVNVSNMLWLGMLAATVTDPTTVTIKSSRGKIFTATPATLRAFADYMFDVDTTTGGLAVWPFMSGDLADVLGAEYQLMFSGGSGNLDYITASAEVEPSLQNISRTIQAQKIRAAYADAGATPNASAIPGPGSVSAPAGNSRGLLSRMD